MNLGRLALGLRWPFPFQARPARARRGSSAERQGAAATGPDPRTRHNPNRPKGFVPAVPAPTGKRATRRTVDRQSCARSGDFSGHSSGPNTPTFQVGPTRWEKARIYWPSGVRRANYLHVGLGQNRRVGPSPCRYLISKPSFLSEARIVSRPFIDLSGPRRFRTRCVQVAACRSCRAENFAISAS